MHKKCNYSAQFQRKMCLLEKMHHHRLFDWSVKNNSNDKSQSYSSGFWGMLYNAPDGSKYGGQLRKTSNCEFKERNITVLYQWKKHCVVFFTTPIGLTCSCFLEDRRLYYIFVAFSQFLLNGFHWVKYQLNARTDKNKRAITKKSKIPLTKSPLKLFKSKLLSCNEFFWVKTRKSKLLLCNEFGVSISNFKKHEKKFRLNLPFYFL